MNNPALEGMPRHEGEYLPCRCCGKDIWMFDGHPIHTRCIAKHWYNHAHNVNASRCKEFKNKAVK